MASGEYSGPRIVGAELRPPDWDYVFAMDDMVYDKPSLAEMAVKKCETVELMIDLALDKDLKFF